MPGKTIRTAAHSLGAKRPGTRASSMGHQAGSGGGSPDPGDPNVALDFLMDEGSGSIIDEINGVTLAAVGTPTYGITEGGIYTPIDPGILLDGAAGSGDEFQLLSSIPALANNSSNHVVVEAWLRPTARPQGEVDYIWSIHHENGTGSWMICYATSNNNLRVGVRMGGDFSTYDFACGNLTGGTVPRHFRWIFDKGSTLRVEENGTLLDAKDWSFYHSANFSNNCLRIGGQYNGGRNNINAEWFRFRVSVGPDVLDNSLYGLVE